MKAQSHFVESLIFCPIPNILEVKGRPVVIMRLMQMQKNLAQKKFQ
jgi:hypothetical protein